MNEKTHVEQEKKEWEKPQLIILARGEPEEAVLGTCKDTAQTGSGAANCTVSTCLNTSAS